MKIKSVLLRWYKSFNVSYEQYADRVPSVSKHPWNTYKPKQGESGDYPFIEIPLEPDITTVVGANESGKSHLISAIMKVITGKGIEKDDAFSRTDLCHYASLRSKNADLWPNIGLVFDATAEEVTRLLTAAGRTGTSLPSRTSHSVALVLCPEGGENHGLIFIDDDTGSVPVSSTALDAVRAHLPEVQFIDSKVAMADQVSIGSLLSAYGDTTYEAQPIYDYEVAQQAARFLVSNQFQQNQPLSGELWKQFTPLRKTLESRQACLDKAGGLEQLLFQRVLGITLDTLRHVAGLRERDRGYIEGLVATWNSEIDRTLNLSEYWQQDQAFTLRVNYKQGILYFEITDKTGSVYTFRERSSGLRFFLSYYIQAKAIEASPSDKGAIVLMDEPDSYLSILGQRNLLAVLEALIGRSSGTKPAQLVYTTHSPFLINRNFPQRLRLVRKGDAEEGTQYIDKARIRRYEPVRSALGVDCAHTLFMGATNVLLEGPTDQYLIVELIRAFVTPENAGDFLDLNDVIFSPADSAPAVEKLIAASHWGDEPIPTVVVLLDDDAAGKAVKDRIIGKARGCKKLVEPEFVLLMSEALGECANGQRIVSTEDLLPAGIYAEGVQRYIEEWYPQCWEAKAEDIKAELAAEAFGANGVVAGAAQVFKKHVFEDEAASFDKLGVLQQCVDALDAQKSATKPAETLQEIGERIRTLCHVLKRKIAESQRAERQRSGKQAIRRIISDFMGTRRNGAAAFDLQVFLLERLQKEADFIGQDAVCLRNTIGGLLEQVGKLRAAKQERLVGSDWGRWKDSIEAIRKNPLAPEVEQDATDESRGSAPTSTPDEAVAEGTDAG